MGEEREGGEERVGRGEGRSRRSTVVEEEVEVEGGEEGGVRASCCCSLEGM